MYIPLMVADAQIGFNINNEQFGWHSDTRDARKNCYTSGFIEYNTKRLPKRLEFLQQRSKQMVPGK